MSDSTANRAPFAFGVRCLAIGANLIGTLGDPYFFRTPKAEGIYRSGSPFATRTAVAIAHNVGLSRHSEFDRTAKALTDVG